ncbi:MAG: hypothetical protein ACP5M0_07385 [Desulfomonilaceae bacterium]
MNRFLGIALVWVLVLFLAASCTSLRSGNAVKAAFDANESDGWLSRHIPGVKKLSEIIPPPNEARKQWDQRLKRQSDLVGVNAPEL